MGKQALARCADSSERNSACHLPGLELPSDQMPLILLSHEHYIHVKLLFYLKTNSFGVCSSEVGISKGLKHEVDW